MDERRRKRASSRAHTFLKVRGDGASRAARVIERDLDDDEDPSRN